MLGRMDNGSSHNDDGLYSVYGVGYSVSALTEQTRNLS